MSILVQDLRYALRTLRRSPGFAVVVILILALGIGANTAIFGLVNAVLLRPLPFPDADRLVMVWEDWTAVGFPRNTPAPANYLDWKKQNQVFDDMAAVRFRTLNLTGDGEPERLDARGVTPSFFSILGIRPMMGRPLLAEDDLPQAAKVAVISYGLWQRRFGGDRGILEKKITLDGEKYSVIGIMPARFSFPARGIDVYVSTGFSSQVWNSRTNHFLMVAARLKSGVTVERAQRDMQTISTRLQRDYPRTNARIGAVVVPMREQYAGSVRLALIVLLGAVGFVLLIACANIANLLLARASSRRKEMAVRAALGAGRWRVARQLLTENMLLSATGAALGVFLARTSFVFLSRLIPPAMSDGSPLTLDYQVLGFTLLVSLLAGALFGLAPTLQASRVDLNDALKQGGRQSGTAGARRMRSSLVVSEVALAVVLLTGAGLLLQTLARLRGVDLGFRPENALAMTTVLSEAKFTKDADRVAFARQVIERVKALPGVVAAGYTSTLPLIIKGNTRGFVVEGRPDPLPGESLDANYREISPEYLQALGVPLRRGRYLEERDGPESKAVIVINETMTRQFWPNEDPLGKRLRFTNDVSKTWRQVVGIAGDIRQMGLEEPPRAEMYIPLQQARQPDPNFLLVRTARDPLSLAAAVRSEVRAVNPDQAISDVRTLEDIVEVEVSQRHLQMLLLGGFSGLALLLATIGIYGVLHYTVAQRTSEIGVRMALGAKKSDVLRMFVLEGMRLAILGLFTGLLAALALTRWMSTLLFGVSPRDPGTYAAVALVLLLVSITASVIPARRASRVDPIKALHYE